MDFTPSQDELLSRDAARELAAKEIAPKAAHFDETMIFPQENVKKLAELGFLGMCVEEKWGRARPPTKAHVLAIDEISQA